MTKSAFENITGAARLLFHNRRVVSLFFLIYFALLGTLLLFIITREATIKDVVVTMATLIVMPALFFLLQAMCITYGDAVNVRQLLSESVAILRRLAIVTIPFILIGVLLYVTLGWVDARFSPPLQGRALLTAVRDGDTWPQIVVSTVRLVLFGIIFPLACIHVWIAVKRQDVRGVLQSIKPILSQAFSLRSVRTYVIGFGFFGILPYVLTAITTPSDRAWLEISLLGARVLLALCLMLVGWVVTVNALQRVSGEVG